MLTADHGVDPNVDHTDHTREYAPLLARFAGGDGRRHDGPLSDVGASVLRWLTGRDARRAAGRAVPRPLAPRAAPTRTAAMKRSSLSWSRS